MFFCDSEWCTILCLEDNKHYVSPSNKLESLEGLGLSTGDIVPGSHAIWEYHGAPYEVEILEVHGTKILF